MLAMAPLGPTDIIPLGCMAFVGISLILFFLAPVWIVEKYGQTLPQFLKSRDFCELKRKCIKHSLFTFAIVMFFIVGYIMSDNMGGLNAPPF
jgi:hypothetical protein